MPMHSSSSLSRHQGPNNNNKGNGKSMSTEEEVKLAALAISLNVRLRSADMPFTMQEHALRYARSLLLQPGIHRPNPTFLARSLKKGLGFSGKKMEQLISCVLIHRCDGSNSKKEHLIIEGRETREKIIVQEFDSIYGPAWHCVVGKSFGSFVTHSPGGFVYFSLDSFSFLLFKTEVQLITESG